MSVGTSTDTAFPFTFKSSFMEGLLRRIILQAAILLSLSILSKYVPEASCPA
jgi:hypothetical protein